MKQMYNRQLFVDVLKAVGPAIGSSKVGDILNCVGFKDGKALAWNGIFGAEHLETEMPFNFAVDYDRLSALLDTYTEDALHINFNGEKNQFVLESLSGSKLTMSARTIDEFPFIAPDLSILTDITDDSLVRAMEVALMTAGSDPSKGVFWSVYFGTHSKDRYHYLLSNDNHRMTYVKIPLPFTGVLVPRPFCEAIVKLGKPDKAGTDGKFIYFTYGKVIMFGSTLPGSYPNFEKIMAVKLKTVPVPEGLKLFLNRARILGAPAVAYDPAKKAITGQTTSDTITETLGDYDNAFTIKTENLLKALDVADGMQTFDKLSVSNYPTTFVALKDLEGFQLLTHMVEM